MSKQPQKIQNKPKKAQIVDQQNQPFLKAISKRVRNINKKLQQITDLKKKEDLKPEQQEKINRKAEYELQRSKLESTADFFRQVYGENVQQYRNNQLQQLDALATAIAVLRGNNNFKEADKLTDLNRAITQPSNLSLTDSTQNISEVLKRFANDYKLKKSLSTFAGQIQPAQQQQQKPQIPVQEALQVKVEQIKPEPVVEKPVVPEVKQEVPQPKIEHQQPVIAQQVPAEQKVVQNTGSQQPAEGAEQKPRGNNRTRGEYRNRDNKGPRQNRGPRQPREQGQQGGFRKEGGERKRFDNQERKPRPNYKAKEENTQVKNNESDSDSSLEREQAVRTFKKEQIRALQDDGFTVTKAKPKAKQGQKQWYDHTHGRKDHQNHKPAN